MGRGRNNSAALTGASVRRKCATTSYVQATDIEAISSDSQLIAQLSKAAKAPRRGRELRVLSGEISRKAAREFKEVVYIPNDEIGEWTYGLFNDPTAAEELEDLQSSLSIQELALLCALGAYRSHTQTRDLLREYDYAIGQSDHVAFALRGSLPVAVLAVRDEPCRPLNGNEEQRLKDEQGRMMDIVGVEAIESKDKHPGLGKALAEKMLKEWGFKGLLFDASSAGSAAIYENGWGLEKTSGGEFGFGRFLMAANGV